MSEQQESITTDVKTPREKDPKRVAQGKRLAEISKAAKQRKRQEIEYEYEAEPVEHSSSGISNVLIGGVVVVGMLGFVGFNMMYNNTSVNKSNEKPKPRPKPNNPSNFDW